MQKSVVTLSLLAAAGAAAAAPPSMRATPAAGGVLQAPVFGYAGVASGDVQPIYGIRGALLRGPSPLLAAANGAKASVSPSQDYAVISGATGANNLQLLSLRADATGIPVDIPGAWPDADQTIFSPSGSAVLLFSAARGAVQVITNLATNPQVGPALTVDSASRRFALSDDASN